MIEYAPVNQRHKFPAFLAGPAERVDPLSGPTDRLWQIEFEGKRKDGSSRFFIWQIAGRLDEYEQVQQRLIERAILFGLCSIWIYEVCKPCDEEMLEFINKMNATKPWMESA